MMTKRQALKLILVIEVAILGLIAFLWGSFYLHATKQAAIPLTSIIIPAPATTLQATLPALFYTGTPTRTLVNPTPTVTSIPITALSSPTETNQIMIGQSVSGKPLIVYRFGDGSIKRMIVAGIHGGYEWNTVHLAEKLIQYVRLYPAVIPANMTLYIMPVLNPDGYDKEFGTEGRANANGVDINRNFDAFWEKDWPREGCWNRGIISAGSVPDSEPETRAIEEFLVTYEVDALISYHSAALGIFPGGQPPYNDSVRLAELLHIASKYPYPPIDSGCKYTGQLIDWAAAHDIAAVDVELSTHTDLDYEINLKVLESFLDWTK